MKADAKHGISDLHTHILPGIDDGSASLEQSVAMLGIQWEQGVKTVVLTPHFYPRTDTPEQFLRRRAQAFSDLREAVGDKSLPRMVCGAEVRYFHGISDCDCLEQLTIGDGRCILIEMGTPPWTGQMLGELEDIYRKQRLIPVLAHIDRYISPWRYGAVLKSLQKLPVMLQANGSFFLRPATRALALRMLKDGQIHLIGSDCHDLADRRPNLDRVVDVICRRLGPEALERIRENETVIFETNHCWLEERK